MQNFSPRKIHQLGVRHIPEDRQKQGLIGDFSIENISLILITKKNFQIISL